MESSQSYPLHRQPVRRENSKVLCPEDPNDCYSYRSSNSEHAGRRLQMRKWPQTPDQLELSSFSKCSRVSLDTFMLFLCLCFVALGVSIVLMADKAESDWGNKIMQATRVAPTIWPLVFAAVVGNTLKAIAHQRAEKGTRLGTVEQLMGSHTVFGTINTCFTLRVFSVSTIALLFLWAFNPVGGQASLRAVVLKSNYTSTPTQLQYQSSNPRSTMRNNAISGASTWSSSRVQVTTLYGAALFSPDAGLQYSNGSSQGFGDLLRRLGGSDSAIKISSEDLWGNVRIPVLHLLPGFDASYPQNWVTVPSEEIPPFESIIGVPIRGLPPNGIGNISFVMQANYRAFKCSNWLALTRDDWPTWMARNYHTLKVHYNASLVDNGTYSDATEKMFSLGFWGFFLDTTEELGGIQDSMLNDSSSDFAARKIIFGSRGCYSNANCSYFITTCQISMPYVEAHVSCSRTETRGRMRCAITAVRESQFAHWPLNWTEVNMVPHGSYLLGTLPTLFGDQHPMTSTPHEVFIYDPPTAFTEDKIRIETVPLGRVPINLFEQRLGLLFNTFCRAITAPTLLAGGTYNQSSLVHYDLPMMVNITADWNWSTNPIYRLSIPWLVVYFMATLVLCLCSVITIIIRYRLRVPEILGHVSTLTRDSPYIHVPCASTLDGGKRARLLKTQWIRIQDVQPEQSVGRISFSSNQSLAGNSLRPQREYQ